MSAHGWHFQRLFDKESFIFVIVHAESDYLAPLHVGDEVVVTATVSSIGNSSFTLTYDIRKNETLAGKAKTIHVRLDKHSRTKTAIPESFKPVLEVYLA